MANDIIGDGKERWDYVPSIANTLAPTTTELNAGIRISQWMTKDGATGFQVDTADAPTSGLEDTFDTAVNGRRSFNNPRIRLKKQSGTDTAYDTLLPDLAGYLVRRRSLTAANAFASAQKIRVYAVVFGEASDVDRDDNMPELYDIPIKMRAQPALRAAVA